VAGDLATRNIGLRTQLEADLPQVALDRVQVQQVLMNLLRNAMEAMEGVTDRERSLDVRSLREGPSAIRVEIRDSGTGIQDVERIFEPFFTTKQHGMGMGLAICRSIVDSHGGKLWVANQETHGAIVAFTLPPDSEAS
jgi:signal transduction histidine kinase